MQLIHFSNNLGILYSYQNYIAVDLGQLYQGIVLQRIQHLLTMIGQNQISCPRPKANPAVIQKNEQTFKDSPLTQW